MHEDMYNDLTKTLDFSTILNAFNSDMMSFTQQADYAARYFPAIFRLLDWKWVIRGSWDLRNPNEVEIREMLNRLHSTVRRALEDQEVGRLKSDGTTMVWSSSCGGFKVEFTLYGDKSHGIDVVFESHIRTLALWR